MFRESTVGLSWDTTHEVIARTVKRGLARRDTKNISHLGIDEKSFGKGQDYVLCDDRRTWPRALDVVPGRDDESGRWFWSYCYAAPPRTSSTTALPWWTRSLPTIIRDGPLFVIRRLIVWQIQLIGGIRHGNLS